MAKINRLTFIILGSLLVIFLTDCVNGRGLIRGRHTRRRKSGKLSELTDKHDIVQREPSKSANTERPVCIGCKQGTEVPHRHRHRKSKRHDRRKTKRGKRKDRIRTAKKAHLRIRPILASEDRMQVGGMAADNPNRRSFDRYGAGFGRAFPRLQRPPDADRLERRLHPNLAATARDLVYSMDRVLHTMKYKLSELHDTYDFAFNSTRYTMMMGVRHNLADIANTNNEVYDTVLHVHLLTKEVYMRAHQHRLTSPTMKSLDRPHFASLRRQMSDSTNEERLANYQRRKGESIEKSCARVDSRLRQSQDRLETTRGIKELQDLIWHINSTVRKLQTEYDESMIIRKMGRYRDGTGIRDSVDDARTYLRNAQGAVREAAHNFRGNRLVYIDWKRQKSGSHLAPVAITDRRSPRSTSISQAARARLRPIINSATQHAAELRRLANRVESIFPPLIVAARKGRRRGGGNAVMAEASYLAGRILDYIKKFHFTLDRIRVVINDEDELRERCEELGSGSGLDEDMAIDCDSFIEEGSGKDSEDVKTGTSTSSDDFEFVDENVPTQRRENTLKRFGRKLDSYIRSLRQKSGDVLSAAKKAKRKATDYTARWDKVKESLNLSEKVAQETTHFRSDWDQEKPNIDRIVRRIKTVSERVDFLSNGTLTKTLKALAKAESKVAKIRAGGDQGSGDRGRGDDEDYDYDDDDDGGEKEGDSAAITAAIEATSKVKGHVRSILTLKRVTPALCGSVKSRISSIRANISDLRNKVDKARLVLSSIQVSISKASSGHLSVPLEFLDNSRSLLTSVEVCVKPKAKDGPILLVTGNDSASYGLNMESNQLSVVVYDKDGGKSETLTSDVELEEEKWYTVLMKRMGQKLSLSFKSDDGETTDSSDVTVTHMEFGQPPPTAVYVGGAPDSVPISLSSDVWQGCLGGLRVNGRSVGLIQKMSDSSVLGPCDSHCSPSPGLQAMVFEGDGFIHFAASVLRSIVRTVFFEFRTRQDNAFLTTVVSRRQRFQLRVRISDGGIVIETTTPSESIVLRSQSNAYNDGKFHTLKIAYRDSTTYPEIDGIDGAFAIERTRPERIQSPTEGILIAGMLSAQRGLQPSKDRPLIGCLRDLKVNEEPVTMSEVQAAKGVHLGSCSNDSVWFNCVEFTNDSSSIDYGTTENGANIVLVVARTGRGPLLHYQKEGKFDIEVTLVEGAIELIENENDYNKRLPDNFRDHFITITIKDDDSSVDIKAMGQDVSFSYGGGIGSWFTNGDNLPHTITIGAVDDPSRQFFGGIGQMIIGDEYIDLMKYTTNNGLSSCKRPLSQDSDQPEPETMSIEC